MTYKPLKDALFYVVQQVTKDFEKAQFREIRNTPFSHSDAFDLSRESLGPGMERWERWRMLPNLHMLREQFLSDWSVRRGKAHHLTDFAGGGNYVTVSDRAKSFIEQYDIGHSRFVPLHVFERPDMTPVDGLWHYWIMTHQFYLKKDMFDREKMLDTTAGMRSDYAWEVANNPVFRNHIKELPFWCKGAIGGKMAIRKDVFIAMKDAGLTGLNEIASFSIIGREPHETVGHLI